ncbi:class II aldolase/adducin family protein [Streptomyces sp. GC420]|uniref:class II aldolase/adducin family protein n=1 Tax=Streptomyces sp. GC420 TaxID=2697568 RepID=UPI001415304B|nr:class II aldolase/adducin family protein [Streptomyces sp. GC420]NBM19397.1 class II aldolase/adducin family protein [Streptomyces sp. GC420]
MHEPIPVEKLHLEMPPVHESAAREREYRKERLAGALRLFGRYGFDEGVAGLLTVRDPEFGDYCWANPFGLAFSDLTPGDLVLVDGRGQVVEGRYRVNQAAFTVHAEVHRARPDVVAVAHSHSPYGGALSSLGELLEPITQESCAFYEDHALYDAYTGVSVDAEEARRVAAALGGRKALILRNHGLLTVGSSVDAAAWWFLSMERCCRIQLAARAAGKPVIIGRRSATETRERLGTDLAAWISYQPLWQRVAGTPSPG